MLTSKRFQMIVNEKAYPNFLRFLDLLDVDTVPSTSTVCVSKSSDKIEWSSETTSSFFARPGSLLDSRMWRMLYDIVRFNACSRSLLESTSNASIGEYLEANGYSDAFREYYLLVSPSTSHIVKRLMFRKSLLLPQSGQSLRKIASRDSPFAFSYVFLLILIFERI